MWYIIPARIILDSLGYKQAVGGGACIGLTHVISFIFIYIITITCSAVWDARNLRPNKQVIAGKLCIVPDFVLEVSWRLVKSLSQWEDLYYYIYGEQFPAEVHRNGDPLPSLPFHWLVFKVHIHSCVFPSSFLKSVQFLCAQCFSLWLRQKVLHWLLFLLSISGKNSPRSCIKAECTLPGTLSLYCHLFCW